jgi:hypothetical protein
MSIQSQTGSFSYSPLSPAGNEIRLFLLNLGDHNERISGRLQHVSLHDDIQYTALSYAWGDPNVTRPITLNGHSFDVTTNLKSALLQLRHRTQLRSLWIDAISINQSDLIERSKQVLLMGNIYQKAQSVEVWLGPGTANSDSAMKLVEELGRIPASVDEWLRYGLKNEYTNQFADVFERQGSRTLEGLDSLFCRPWWTRVWVVQEVSVAKQDMVRVICGRRSVAWTNILTAAHAIEHCWPLVRDRIQQRYPKRTCEGFGEGIRMVQCRRDRATDPPFKLLELMHQHRDCDATDPRDHLYGLWGLAGDSEDLGIVPDYLKSPHDIFKAFVKSIVTQTGSLDVLCACQQPTNLQGLPSWVPDWSMHRQTAVLCISERYCGGDTFPGCPSRNFEKYSAARNSHATALFSNDMNVLTVRGSAIGCIVTLGHTDAEGLTFEDVDMFGHIDSQGKSSSTSTIFNQWLDMAQQSHHASSRYPTHSDLIDAFCRTLVANRNNQMMKPPPINRAQAADSLLAQSNGMKRFDPREILSMTTGGFTSCIQVCYRRRLAIANVGYMGLVPFECQVGDYLCILSGCSLPVLLRKQDQHYVFVGESYFYGVSDGELSDVERGEFTTQNFTIR